MQIDPTPIAGVFTVRFQPVTDERGSFVRTFDGTALASVGLDPTVAQCSDSINRRAGTLRGMHLQRKPFGETKLIRCTRGAVFDVAVDTRPWSNTFGRWLGFELVENDDRAVVLAPGIAHGFLTLLPSSTLTYAISMPYAPEASVGFLWNDPRVGIGWPSAPEVISERDRQLPPLDDNNDWTQQ